MSMTPQEIEAIAAAVAEKLKPDQVDLDWSQVEYPKASQPRPQCAKLDDRKMAMLLVCGAIRYDNAMAQVIRTAVEMYLVRKWPSYIDDLKAIAARERMTPEGVFTAIVKGDLKP